MLIIRKEAFCLFLKISILCVCVYYYVLLSLKLEVRLRLNLYKQNVPRKSQDDLLSLQNLISSLCLNLKFSRSQDWEVVFQKWRNWKKKTPFFFQRMVSVFHVICCWQYFKLIYFLVTSSIYSAIWRHLGIPIISVHLSS